MVIHVSTIKLIMKLATPIFIRHFTSLGLFILLEIEKCIKTLNRRIVFHPNIGNIIIIY